MSQTTMQQFIDWLDVEWSSNTDFSIDLYMKIRGKAESLMGGANHSYDASIESITMSDSKSHIQGYFNERYK